MARPLVPRRHIAFKWPLDLHERIRDEINTRGVSFAAFVYRACELYLDTLKSEREAATPSALGLPRTSSLKIANKSTIAHKIASADSAPPSDVFERYRRR